MAVLFSPGAFPRAPLLSLSPPSRDPGEKRESCALWLYGFLNAKAINRARFGKNWVARS